MTSYDKYTVFKQRIAAIGLTPQQWEIIIAAVAEALGL